MRLPLQHIIWQFSFQWSFLWPQTISWKNLICCVSKILAFWRGVTMNYFLVKLECILWRKQVEIVLFDAKLVCTCFSLKNRLTYLLSFAKKSSLANKDHLACLLLKDDWFSCLAIRTHTPLKVKTSPSSATLWGTVHQICSNE